jgi:protein TonB
MKRPELTFAIAASLALHAALFILVGTYQGARVTFAPGALAVTLDIVPEGGGPGGPSAGQAGPPPGGAAMPAAPAEQPRAEAPPPQPEAAPPQPAPPPQPVAEEPPQPAPVQPEAVAQPAPPPTAAPLRTVAAPQAPSPRSAEGSGAGGATGPATGGGSGGGGAAGPSGAAAGTGVGPGSGAGEGAGSGVGSGTGDSGDGSGSGPGGASAVGLQQPEYPFYSRRHGEEGTVVVDVEVLAAGKPGRIEVVTSSGHEHLDQAAVDALKGAAYIPARRAGVPITTTKRFAFTFKLDGSEAE